MEKKTLRGNAMFSKTGKTFEKSLKRGVGLHEIQLSSTSTYVRQNSLSREKIRDVGLEAQS